MILSIGRCVILEVDRFRSIIDNFRRAQFEKRVLYCQCGHWSKNHWQQCVLQLIIDLNVINAKMIGGLRGGPAPSHPQSVKSSALCAHATSIVIDDISHILSEYSTLKERWIRFYLVSLAMINPTRC